MITNLPSKVGTLAVNFTKQRFREQSWIDTATEPWRRRRPGAKRNRGRALLVNTGRLRRGNRIIKVGPLSVTIGNDVPYAAAHNYGFNGVVSIPAHTRKKTKKGTPRKKTVVSVIGEIPVKAHTRKMNMPRRRFMGRSMYLNNQIGRLITAEINKIFK